MSSNSNVHFGFVDECLHAQLDEEDDVNNFSTEAMRREIEQISARSDENRNRNVSSGFSRNEQVAGDIVDDPHVVFDCDSLRAESITLRYALPEQILRMMKNPKPAQPAFVFKLADVKDKFPQLNDEQILQLSTQDILSKVDVLAKALAIRVGENSLHHICGGRTANLCNQPSKYIVRGFLVHKVPPTLDGAIQFANSREAEGGREEAQKMKLLANIEAQSREGAGCNFIIVKDGEHVVVILFLV
jgi:hypothetical protein